MENLEQKFLEAIKQESRSAKGYTLDLVDRTFVPRQASVLSDCLVFKFVVPVSGLSVQFRLSIDSGALISLWIDSKSGENLCFEGYLLRHKLGDLKRQLFDHRRDIPFVVHLIFELFNGEMNEIITGKRWEDIPYDWTNY